MRIIEYNKTNSHEIIEKIDLGESLIIKGMPDTVYHSVTSHLGSTSIINADKSIDHMKHYKPKAKSDLYKAYHLGLLEGDRKSKDIIVVKGTFAKGENKIIREQAKLDGKLCLNESDGKSLDDMLLFQKNSDFFQKFVDTGDSEVSFFTVFENGIKAKARVDSIIFEANLFMDLKTIHSPSSKFRAIKNKFLMESKGYHLQTAHYMLVIKNCTGEVFLPIHFIGENAPPYKVYNTKFSDIKLTEYIDSVKSVYDKIIKKEDDKDIIHEME